MYFRNLCIFSFFLALLMPVHVTACAEENIGSMSAPALRTVPEKAIVNRYQEGFFCLSVSKIVKIPTPVVEAQLTNDHTKAVCITPDGELLLYELDADGAIFGDGVALNTGPASCIVQFADSGFVWKGTDAGYYRYLFGEHKITEIGPAVRVYMPVVNSLCLVYARDGKFCYLDERETEAAEFGDYRDYPLIWSASADGSMAVCADHTEDKIRVMVTYKGETVYENEFKNDAYYGMSVDNVFHDSDNDIVILWSPHDCKIDFVGRDGLFRRNLTEDQTIDRVFCLNGKDLAGTNAADPLNVVTKGDDEQKSLFMITASGESLKMAEGMKDAVVLDGWLFFIDGKDRLMSSAIKGDKIETAKKIDTGVVTVYSSTRFQYYANGVKNRTDQSAFGKLYVYNTDSGKKHCLPVKPSWLSVIR